MQRRYGHLPGYGYGDWTNARVFYCLGRQCLRGAINQMRSQTTRILSQQPLKAYPVNVNPRRVGDGYEKRDSQVVV